MRRLADPSRRFTHRFWQTQAGFTLVELMVAMFIGLLIVSALITLHINITRNQAELTRTTGQIESGFFSTQFLENDIALAGFWGGFIPSFDDLTASSAPGDVPTAVPDPCLVYNTTNWDAAYKTNLIGIPAQAYDAVPSSCSTLLANKQANTDVLVVRHADACIPGAPNCDADTPSQLYFQNSFCDTEVTTTPYVLDQSGFSLHKLNCSTTADKRRFISNIYYVRDYAVTPGDGIPTLVRSQFDLATGATTPAQQAPVPLVSGIEGFHVEFGIDSLSKTGAAVDYSSAVSWLDSTNRTTPTNRGDGVPDGSYIQCTTASPCTAAQLMNAVSVKLYVLARSRDPSPGYVDNKTYTLGSVTLGPFNDNYKRHLFSTTIRLTNISGRRETS